MTATITPKPSLSPTLTNTPHEDPGIIVTLGEEVSSPWYPGIPIFSPDGKIVALASRRIRFWDANTYQFIREFSNPFPEECYLEKAAFSSDGSLFAVSITGCWSVSNPIGHLIVWDTKTGELLKDWTQEYATMIDPNIGSISIPMSAIAFLPKSTKIAYANGNTIEVRDVRRDENPVILSLGKEMYATEISIREDSEFLYVLMSWDILSGWAWSYKTKFGVQIWGLNTKDLRHDIKIPDADFPDEDMNLHGENLLHRNYLKGTAELTNLTMNQTISFLYRQGRQFLSPDLNFVIFERYISFEDDEKGIELWNTDTWRNLYTFKPDFGKNWFYGPVDFAFSPDNTILAIAHQERLTLWDIHSVVQTRK